MADTNPPPTIQARAVRNGREYITYSDGTSHTRRLDRATGEPISAWAPVERTVDDTNDANATAAAPPPTRYLYVVAEHQAAGEPKHWSLFSHVPDEMGTGLGEVWQVTGDAELMHFEHHTATDRLASPDLAWHQVLSSDLTEGELRRVDEIARAERPPSAPNRAAVTEHCQGWTVRVVKRLVEEGVVRREGVVEGLEGFLEAIRR